MMRYLLACCLLASPALVAPQARVPCDAQANVRQFHEPLDPATPKAEREQFESKRGNIALQAREYVFDQAPQIASGSTIDGNGATWRNGHRTDLFPFNNGAYAIGIGAGWLDVVTVAGKQMVTLKDPALATNYPPGILVYVWTHASGGTNPQAYGLANQRRKVTARSGNVLTLDSAIDPRVTALCWLADAVPCSNVNRDAFQTTSASKFTVGQPLYLTSGKSIADELRGEWVEVAANDGGKVTFKRSASRSYDTAALAPIKPVENVTIRNVTFAPSPHATGLSLFVKFARNWRFEGCQFQGPVLIAGASDVTFSRCTFQKRLMLNTTTRVTLVDCQCESIRSEESDCDLTIRDCLFIGATDNAIATGLDSERLTVQDVTIVRPGQCPIGCTGPDNRISGVRIYGAPVHACYLQGPRLSVSDLRSDGPVICYAGDGQLLRGVWANRLQLGHTAGGPSSGRYRDCSEPVVVAGSWGP